jgi:predicted AAA+ superfamily ATPase
LEFKRDIYNIIEKRIENKFIIALTSLRRVGKTTILYQLIQNLIEKKLNLLIYFSSLLMIIVQK